MPTQSSARPYDRPSRGSRIVAIGDSIIAFPGTPPGMFQDDGDLTWAVALSSGKLKFAGNFGVGGYTVQQIATDLVPKALAVSPRPDWCLISAGSNNMEHDATDRADAKAKLIGIFATLRAVDIEPIITTVGPYGALTATGKTNAGEWNAWLASKCAELGVTVIDTITPLVNPSTFGFNVTSETRPDGSNVHPKGVGYKKRAQAIVDAISPKTRPNLPKIARVNGGSNLFGDGLFLTNNGAGLSGQMAYGATAGAGATISQVAGATDGVLGNWQRFVTAAGAGFVADFTQSYPASPRGTATRGAES